MDRNQVLTAIVLVLIAIVLVLIATVLVLVYTCSFQSQIFKEMKRKRIYRNLFTER
jgi:hypothetical protein